MPPLFSKAGSCEPILPAKRCEAVARLKLLDGRLWERSASSVPLGSDAAGPITLKPRAPPRGDRP